ncbi:hypothetical protein BDV3_004244 [Batrachochytrium dendrobatidis]|uniref:Pyridoxamine 5'-phosphate oxidase Alr4036 family FMN-binding domain-containing protein n=1 Tax=Batrachochytrium dendrobatidis (strain JEL423) TaxID=403673 RepID=A0A177WCV7_BATDL|nr:hypothetical protein BDEG_21625 [Batrachochytrium dendrobatidis JEL423]
MNITAQSMPVGQGCSSQAHLILDSNTSNIPRTTHSNPSQHPEHDHQMQLQTTQPELFNANLPVASQSPLWRAQLEQSIRQCQDINNFYVSLATIKAFGRPANRTIYFRGFMTQSSPDEGAVGTTGSLNTDTALPSTSMDSDSITSSMDVLRLSCANIKPKTANDILGNVLVFVADSRSGSVADILHGSRYGEVCWFLPGTKEQYRLSGALHLVMSADHPLQTNHQVPLPFADHGSSRPNVDWEAVRLKVWENISSLRRASFAWPQPGQDRLDIQSPVRLPSLYAPSTVRTLSDCIDVNKKADSTENASKPLAACCASGNTLETTGISFMGNHHLRPLVSENHHPMASEPGVLDYIHSDTASPPIDDDSHSSVLKQTTDLTLPTTLAAKPNSEIQEHHKVAWANFCLLLLDVDGVDHLNMGNQPHTRTKHRKISPAVDEVMYLSQTHHKQTDRWITKDVNP